MSIQIITGDVRDILPTIPAKSVQCVVTSPPYYGLRNYGVDGQIGLESTLTEYIETMVDVFRFVRETLADDGVMWLNIGDSYATDTKGSGGQTVKQITNAGEFYESRKFNHGLKPKDLMMVPARLALALQVDGWYLRSDIIWHKPNPMPESVQDRPTSAHEHIFLLTKSSRYYYDADAIREPLALSSVARLAQDVDAQIGSDRANGGAKTNGTMKAVQRTDKQRGHSRRHAGFNDRWDAMPKDEQQANGANARNVWSIATHPFSGWTPVSRTSPVAEHEADDDTMRTPSEDCPVHAWQGRSDPIRVGDERASGASIRTSGSNGRRAPGQSSGYAPIVPTDAVSSAGESWDSLPLLCADSANPHSNGTSRTDRDPETNQPCTPYAQSGTRTGDTSDVPGSSGSVDHMIESSIGSDDSPVRPSPKMASHIARKLSVSRSFEACTCSYHKIVTESISHFATFPPEIPRRCILTGSREGDTILDPFAGAGTTLLVADRLGRNAIGIELNPEYVTMAEQRIYNDAPLLATVLPTHHTAADRTEGEAG